MLSASGGMLRKSICKKILSIFAHKTNSFTCILEEYNYLSLKVLKKKFNRWKSNLIGLLTWYYWKTNNTANYNSIAHFLLSTILCKCLWWIGQQHLFTIFWSKSNITEIIEGGLPNLLLTSFNLKVFRCFHGV